MPALVREDPLTPWRNQSEEEESDLVSECQEYYLRWFTIYSLQRGAKGLLK
jgi:hypothetical protein